jgi:TolB protein
MPDGRSIVYVRTLATDQSLWLMDVTGRHPRRLTRSVGDEDPAVSPDGTRIAFLRGPQVFVVSANGGEGRQLTPSNLEAGGRLDWSPDGSRILFGANDQVYTIRLDGSGLTKLTSGKHAYCSDSFSPDGRRVLLIDNCGSATNSQLYSMSVGGGHPVPVRNGLGAHWISLGTAG